MLCLYSMNLECRILNKEQKESIMVLKVAILSLGMMIGTTLYAKNKDANSRGFLGIEVAASSVEGERLNDFNHQGFGAEYGLRLGAQSDEWRATFAFDYFNSNSDDQNVEKSLAMIDYFFYHNDSNFNIQPFIGANIGLINYESTGVDATDFIYGGQAGVIIGINEKIDFDLSYRYSLSGSTKVNNLSGIIFGLNYIY